MKYILLLAALMFTHSGLGAQAVIGEFIQSTHY